MITCKLGDKKYTVDFIPGRVLREIDPAVKMYGKLSKIAQQAAEGKIDPADAEEVDTGTAMDTMVKWFCMLFGNQFTPDEVYDGYPVDRLMHDVTFALLAVQSSATQVLSEFPIPAAQEKQEKKPAKKPAKAENA